EGRCAPFADQARQDFDHAWRADTPIDIDCQSLLGELVGYCQTLELLTIGTPVDYEKGLLAADSRRRSTAAKRPHPASANSVFAYPPRGFGYRQNNSISPIATR